jgi:DNA-binding MarR family transcriptional regulator
VNLLVTSLERDGLVERRPRRNHGRILEIHPTREGIRRLERAYPVVIELEDRISASLTGRELATVKRWLVQAAVTLTAPGRTSGGSA